MGAQSWGSQPVQMSGSHRQGFLEEVKLRTGLKKEQESDSRRVWKAILGSGGSLGKGSEGRQCTVHWRQLSERKHGHVPGSPSQRESAGESAAIKVSPMRQRRTVALCAATWRALFARGMSGHSGAQTPLKSLKPRDFNTGELVTQMMEELIIQAGTCSTL